jgi:hypothetical protein
VPVKLGHGLLHPPQLQHAYRCPDCEFTQNDSTPSPEPPREKKEHDPAKPGKRAVGSQQNLKWRSVVHDRVARRVKFAAAALGVNCPLLVDSWSHDAGGR